MSDFTWYSRLLIWIGCLVLLTESIAGRPFGFATPVAVLMLIFGLFGFLGGLAVDAREPRFVTAEGEAPVIAAPPEMESQQPEAQAVSAVDSAPPPEPAALAPPPEPVVDVQTVQPDPAPTEIVTRAPATRAVGRAPLGAVSSDVEVGGRWVGTLCLACQEPLRAGQVAATCAECGGVHHATCWVGNHFHCRREGCSGHGRLEAPPEDSADDPPQE